jgi:threonyl-tRNA synthetase
MGILLEHYAGKMPVWLAPTQAIVMNITDKQTQFVSECTLELKKQGVRAKSDLRNEKIGFKIREHTIEHVPYLLVVGDREVETRTVSVRTQDGQDLGVMPLDKFIGVVREEKARKGRSE